MTCESFKSIFLAMPIAERDRFAAQCKSTRATLTLIAYGHKQVELGFADVIAAQLGQRVRVQDLPLTARAKVQLVLRSPAIWPDIEKKHEVVNG